MISVAPFNPYFSSFDWDGPSTGAIRDKLEPVYLLLMGTFGLIEPSYPLEIHRRPDHPRTTLGQINGEMTHRIGLSAERYYYQKYTYQFAHELTHILTNWNLSTNRNYRWFEETLAELSSIFVIREFAKNRPYPVYTESQWQDYAEGIDNRYRPQLSARGIEGSNEVAGWFSNLINDLTSDPKIRELNWAIAKGLFPFFQANPSLWRACGYLNMWDASTDFTFSDYLNSWQNVLVQEGENMDIISIFRRTLYGN